MIELKNERKRILKDRIYDFFSEEYDMELGSIGQEKVLDFFLEQLGEAVYNAALDDALSFLKQQQENTEADFYLLYKKN